MVVDEDVSFGCAARPSRVGADPSIVFKNLTPTRSSFFPGKRAEEGSRCNFSGVVEVEARVEEAAGSKSGRGRAADRHFIAQT